MTSGSAPTAPDAVWDQPPPARALPRPPWRWSPRRLAARRPGAGPSSPGCTPHSSRLFGNGDVGGARYGGWRRFLQPGLGLEDRTLGPALQAARATAPGRHRQDTIYDFGKYAHPPAIRHPAGVRLQRPDPEREEHGNRPLPDRSEPIAVRATTTAEDAPTAAADASSTFAGLTGLHGRDSHRPHDRGARLRRPSPYGPSRCA